MADAGVNVRKHAGSAGEVLLAFLRLGCTSFGGPVAHLGYFERELAERRGWCDRETLSETIALAQSLPGPSSSQVGFALGLMRAGWPGALAAWFGFTLPSAVLMLVFAYGHDWMGNPVSLRALHGLQLLAISVVAQAVLAMRRTLAPDPLRMAVAAVGAALTLSMPARYGTLLAIAAGAAIGWGLWKNQAVPESKARAICGGVSKQAGTVCATVFAILLAASFLPSGPWPIPLWSGFYRSGALVFGGGHVVLPLLEDTAVARGWVTQSAFLAGYGAAQALPGPLFAFAAYLGAVSQHALWRGGDGLLALVAIFLPGLLVMAAALAFRRKMLALPGIHGALKGINANVVGVLAAALYQPLWRTTVHNQWDVAAALAGLLALVWLRIRPLAVAAVLAVWCIVAKLS